MNRVRIQYHNEYVISDDVKSLGFSEELINLLNEITKLDRDLNMQNVLVNYVRERIVFKTKQNHLTGF